MAKTIAKKKTTTIAKTKNLVIVESPAKARTLSRILGDDYAVTASMGHVRDLPSKDLGIDVKHDFEPKYAIIKERFRLVNELRQAVKGAEHVYLATDPDREGEAISWHIMEATNLDPDMASRVVFHEITEDAVLDSFKHPKEIDMELVNAQQARRLLDRLVGYKLSPVLWNKVRRGLSAGRVQSVALRIVADREREVEAFVQREYWSIDANLAPNEDGTTDRTITAKLEKIAGKRANSLEIPDEAAAQALVADLQPATFNVEKVDKRLVHRRPAAPFITSTLQQEAWRKLRFPARKTMSVAQQLYEGISVGLDGPVGLITYMRTDSTNLAAQAQQEIRGLISEKYGEDYLPKTARTYTKKVKGAQEAHEAIRSTSILRTPDGMRQYLDQDQIRLYDLIWRRTLASQMNDALMDSTTVEIQAKQTPSGTEYVLRVSGTVMRFNGFLAVYQEGRDDEVEDEEKQLPEMTAGQILRLLGLDPKQHFTQPPPRFNDATLVRALEEHGIGRPSTYAPTISTIIDRGYVKREQGRFQPEKLGLVVNDLLTDHFKDILNLDFTAQMEEKLDGVARGEQEWAPLLKEFYSPFERTIEDAMQNMPNVGDQLDEPTDEICEKCGKPMVIKPGRYGKFLACTGFPDCRNTRDMAKRLHEGCPQCGGDLVERRSRKTRRTFFGCANYPTCTFLTNGQPLEPPCPQCGKIVVPQGRENAKCIACDWQGTREELGVVEEEPVEGVA